MPWKAWAAPLIEFLGGLATLQLTLPLENVLFTVTGVALVLVGLNGLTKPLLKSEPRPYEQRPY